MRFIKRTNYMYDIRFFAHWSDLAWYLALGAALLAAPLFLGVYWVSLLILMGIYAIVALGLNLLTGFTGLISLGHAALFAVGAYSSAILTGKYGASFWLALPASGFLAMAAGVVVGVPSLRMKGLYLAISTMGLGFIVEEIIIQWSDLTNGVNGMSLTRPSLWGLDLTSDFAYYYLVFAVLLIMLVVTKNLLRTPTGRAMIAIRDNDIAAMSMGINLAFYKTAAFSISAFYAGIAGSLFGHFMYFIGPENFDLLVSISFLVMLLVGGVGSVRGAIFGAVFITLLPEMISLGKDYLPDFIGRQSGLQAAVYGLILILFIRFEPLGLNGWYVKSKFYFEHFPFYKQGAFKRTRKFYRAER
ncbi:MAG: branched-chain amino acid ABC transporter permease [Pseudomonadota bacterium]